MGRALLITAEHASRCVPPAFADCLVGQDKLLDTHRAWDVGTAELAAELSARLRAPLLMGEITRLLVDLNRCEHHRQCFSDWSRRLDRERKAQLLDRYHRPYWRRFGEHVERTNRLIHLACHSFTPILHGVVRSTDLGLLYDPQRAPEREWARGLLECLRRKFSGLRVHANQPYRGTSNGIGQQYRGRSKPHRLISVELEINASLVTCQTWSNWRQSLIEAVAEYLA